MTNTSRTLRADSLYDGSTVDQRDVSLLDTEALDRLFDHVFDLYTAVLAGGGGGGGAPTTASYVTIGAEAGLTAERVLTAGSGITVTDGGAGSTVTVALGTHAANHTAAGSDPITITEAQVTNLTTDLATLTSGVAASAVATRAINTSAPLSGGGNLTADRTIALNASAASRLLGRGSASGAGAFEEITLGSGLTMTGAVLSAGSSGGAGHTEVDFGAFPGSWDTTVAVTGQTGILSGSVVRAWLRPLDTTDHSADEHLLVARDLQILAGNVVAGTGFTIYAIYNTHTIRRLGNADMLQIHGAGARPNANKNIPDIEQNTTPRLYGKWAVSWQWQ